MESRLFAARDLRRRRWDIPFITPLSSVRIWGGSADDYLPLHQWFDESKAITADFRHRALRHHAEGIFMLERFFGPTITLSTGRVVPVRLIGEQHVREDLGFIPGFADWVRCIRPRTLDGPRPSDPTAMSIRSPSMRRKSAPAPSLKEGQAMPRIVETTVFRLDELSERAREQARAWYREASAGDDWHECVFDDFETICAILVAFA